MTLSPTQEATLRKIVDDAVAICPFTPDVKIDLDQLGVRAEGIRDEARGLYVELVGADPWAPPEEPDTAS